MAIEEYPYQETPRRQGDLISLGDFTVLIYAIGQRLYYLLQAALRAQGLGTRHTASA